MSEINESQLLDYIINSKNSDMMFDNIEQWLDKAKNSQSNIPKVEFQNKKDNDFYNMWYIIYDINLLSKSNNSRQQSIYKELEKYFFQKSYNSPDNLYYYLDQEKKVGIIDRLVKKHKHIALFNFMSNNPYTFQYVKNIDTLNNILDIKNTDFLKKIRGEKDVNKRLESFYLTVGLKTILEKDNSIFKKIDRYLIEDFLSMFEKSYHLKNNSFMYFNQIENTTTENLKNRIEVLRQMNLVSSDVMDYFEIHLLDNFNDKDYQYKSSFWNKITGKEQTFINNAAKESIINNKSKAFEKILKVIEVNNIPLKKDIIQFLFLNSKYYQYPEYLSKNVIGHRNFKNYQNNQISNFINIYNFDKNILFKDNTWLKNLFDNDFISDPIEVIQDIMDKTKDNGLLDLINQSIENKKVPIQDFELIQKWKDFFNYQILKNQSSILKEDKKNPSKRKIL